MKRLLLVCTVIVIVFGACTFETALETGSVFIQLPSRTFFAQALDGAVYETARIRLNSGRTHLPIEGLEYIDVDEDSVTIGGLLPDSYTIRVSFGQSTDEGILYSVTAYGESDPFAVSAGVTTNVKVGLKRQIVVSDESTIGNEMVNVVAVGMDLYSLDASGVIYKNGTRLELPELDGLEIQSISLGGFFDATDTWADELWINTNSGIYPYRQGSLDVDFSAGMALAPGESLKINRTFVHLIEDAGGAPLSIVIGVQGAGLDSLMGTFVDYVDRNNPAAWVWYGWNALDDVSGLGAIKEALTAVGEVVYDFVFEDEYLYAATALQTFYFTTDDLDELIAYFADLGDVESEMELETVLGFFNIVVLSGGDDEGKVIKTVEVEDSVLYFGTNTANDPHNGVLAAEIDATTGAVEADAVKLEETDGFNIQEILYSEAAGLAIARSEDAILVLDDGEFHMEIPFYAGLPGAVRDAVWVGTRLYIAGTEGLAHIDF